MLGKGLHLTLLFGSGAPTPASSELLLALQSASVQTSTTGRSGFQLAFETDDPRRLLRILLRAGLGLDPVVRTILILTQRGRPHVLIDGVVTQHQLSHAASGKATLTLTGEDLTTLLDRVDGTGRTFPGLASNERVLLLLAPYAALGIVPLVLPPLLPDRKLPTESTPTQRGTELAYIRRLADDVGYVFHLQAGPTPGQSVAYWGPEVQLGEPVPALSIDLGHASNVDELSFTSSLARKGLPLLDVQIDGKSVTIPLPPVSPLRPPLGAVPQPPVRTTKLRDVDGKSAASVILKGLGEAAAAAETIEGEASLDLARYPTIVRPRQLIGVRGAASPYNGLYAISRVSTQLRRGSATQRISFSRAGLFSATPRVLV